MFDATTPAVRLPSVLKFHVDQRVGRDHVAGDAALGLEQQPLGLDVDDLPQRADLQRECEACELTNAQAHGGALRAKSGERRLDDVLTG